MFTRYVYLEGLTNLLGSGAFLQKNGPLLIKRTEGWLPSSNNSPLTL